MPSGRMQRHETRGRGAAGDGSEGTAVWSAAPALSVCLLRQTLLCLHVSREADRCRVLRTGPRSMICMSRAKQGSLQAPPPVAAETSDFGGPQEYRGDCYRAIGRLGHHYERANTVTAAWAVRYESTMPFNSAHFPARLAQSAAITPQDRRHAS
jgi:hypothetical protein